MEEAAAVVSQVDIQLETKGEGSPLEPQPSLATEWSSPLNESNFVKLQETVTSMVREHSEDAAQLIRIWLLEENNSRKAAVFLITIGLELSAGIFKFLREDEIEYLAFEISRLDAIWPDQKDAVLQEAHKLMTANRFISAGGIDFARELLEKSLGRQKTIDIINRLTSSLQVRPFDFIRRVDPAHLFNFIQQEHPQTIALVLAYLEPNKASIILQNLPNDIQGEVARRITRMDRVIPEVLREVERVLEKKFSTLSGEDYCAAGGVDSIVEILHLVDRASEKHIMEFLEDDDPELAEEIKRRMFLFEDIVMLDDRAIQKVMREVDSQELAKALKGVNAEVQNKIFNNMSKRAACMLKEDMEFMGPIRLIDLEDAQQKIVSIVRHLEDTGEIVIARADEDELVVDNIKSEFKWENITWLSRKKIEMILLKADYTTLVTALKVTRQEIYKKLTEPMRFFKRLKLKSDIKKLTDLSADEVTEAQDNIASIARQLNSGDYKEESDDSEDYLSNNGELGCLKC